MGAISNGHDGAAHLLIGAGADPKLSDLEGETACTLGESAEIQTALLC